jgi:hypothetical protein
MPAMDNAGFGGGASRSTPPNSHMGGTESGIPPCGGGTLFPHPTKIICDVTYLAGQLQVQIDTVREWLREYEIPAWKVGKVQFFDSEVFLSKMPTVRDEATSERRGHSSKTATGKVEGDRRRGVEAKRKARPKNKDV